VRRSLALWAGLALLYATFLLWYDGGGGPLTPQEVERYVSILEERGADPARVAALREFLAGDTGSDFVMANFIRFEDRPGAREDLDRYMAHMYPALLARACHPVAAGPVVGPALDLWGVEDAERWSLVGLVRYRSRRDLAEIATAPAFGDAHAHKTASMQKTVAVPMQPFLLLGGPRWLVAGALALAGAAIQPLLRRGARRLAPPTAKPPAFEAQE
jgi:hypothetical protein